jgi:hypothetical protein
VTFQERMILTGTVNPFEVPTMLYCDLASAVPEDASAQIQARVNTARALQQRYARRGSSAMRTCSPSSCRPVRGYDDRP